MRKLDILTDHGEISMDIVKSYEESIGYKFPFEYKKLICKHNLLHPIQDSFDYINVYGENEEGGIAFLGYGNIPHEKIEISQKMISDPAYEGMPNMAVFGRDGNGDYICFDYRENPKTDAPKVVVLYHDDHIVHEDGTSHMVVNHVANSFEEFIDMLYEYRDEDE